MSTPTPSEPGTSRDGGADARRSGESGDGRAGGGNGVLKGVDWGDFRDHLATADERGRRKWIYPRQPAGRYTRARTVLSGFLLAILFAGPFIRIQGNPLLMMNIVDRRFVILGQVFWPQDFAIFAVAMLLFLTGIVVFTAAFGRLWCGWTCPQTVLMELVFRKIEYWIEGDAHHQRALTAAPWTVGKWVKRVGKHAIFLGLSFVIGNTLLAYIIGSDELIRIITDPPGEHLTGLTFMVLFTLLFYGIFARFREQACTFICPYGRLQSTLLDENSIVVAYDHRRGERRAPLRRRETQEQRRTQGLGDCIECRQCVTVCPTGIDIRDGTQMECVHCTACMDACDAVMDRIGRSRGLIRYASLNGIERGEPLRVTPRLIGYAVLLLGLIGLFLFLLFTRSDVQTTLLRAPGGLYQTLPDGRLSNLYILKLVNKTHREMAVELRLEGMEGVVRVMGPPLVVRGGERVEASVLVELEPAVLRGANTPVRLGVWAEGRPIETVRTAFIGPRTPSTQKP
ncbi:MAG: cytochrome c oxidase accessory protein CcoG [Verrucomicrobiae bacterium]|nr:cytochrome c oxidase accessory protein CcoG [Verrucomicrobiae bacterium]